MTSPNRESQWEASESEPVVERNGAHAIDARLASTSMLVEPVPLRRDGKSAAGTGKRLRTAAPVALQAHRPAASIEKVQLQRGAAAAPASVVRTTFRAEVDADASETLFRDDFLRAVVREKRRADRSKSPLSVAVFQLHPGTGAVDRRIDRLLAHLASVKRVTDGLARLSDGAVAILLLDTNAVGLAAFIDKVAPATKAGGFVCDAGTYPDPSFDQRMERHLRSSTRERPAGHVAPVHAHTYRLKRWLDVAGAAVALALLSPVMLLTALAVRLSSPGPIIFRQTRLGKAGVPFTLYKFRSMRSGADDSIHREFVAGLINGTDGDTEATGQYKMKSDPRITAVGSFIRKTSIDELPQLINVLKGEMSLVGPRPPLEYEVENYLPWHRRRVFEMKPGLTGIWQVEGRSKVSFDDMVRMDLRYLRRCSLGFDLMILFRTVWVVMTCEGAD